MTDMCPSRQQPDLLLGPITVLVLRYILDPLTEIRSLRAERDIAIASGQETYAAETLCLYVHMSQNTQANRFLCVWSVKLCGKILGPSAWFNVLLKSTIFLLWTRRFHSWSWPLRLHSGDSDRAHLPYTMTS